MTGTNVKSPNTCNSTNIMPKACLASQLLSLIVMQSSIWCGLITSKRLTDRRKQDVFVMGQQGLAKFWSLKRHMLIAWIRLAPSYSMQLHPLKTSLYLVPTCPMPLLKLHLQSSPSSFDLTGHSVNGGLNTSNKTLFYLARLFRSSWQCKAIRSPLDFGKRTWIKFYERSA